MNTVARDRPWDARTRGRVVPLGLGLSSDCGASKGVPEGHPVRCLRATNGGSKCAKISRESEARGDFPQERDALVKNLVRPHDARACARTFQSASHHTPPSRRREAGEARRVGCLVIRYEKMRSARPPPFRVCSWRRNCACPCLFLERDDQCAAERSRNTRKFSF